MSDLSICTVNCGTAALVDANWRLTAALNSGPPARWIVAENTPPGQGGAVSPSDERFHVTPGVSRAEAARWNGSYLHGVNHTSYQHGEGLNRALRHVRSRWALLLDPDFCIVVPEWCTLIPEYMEREGLAFFGAPYHPGLYKKYRYFPCAICMFIDLEKVPREDLDFCPVFRPRTRLSRAAEKFFPRLFITRSTDVGWRVFARYGRGHRLRSACVQGAWRAPRSSGRLRALIRALLPDCLSVTPKRKGYATDQTFRSSGFPDPSSLGWMTEEYFWRGEPFGFHIRMRVQKGMEVDRLFGLVASFASPEVVRRFTRPVAVPREATRPAPGSLAGYRATPPATSNQGATHP
ncbi:MAG TPA: hypothetical protein VNK04_00520 [Gemmataceae bacterium]|nr:hypothetical protein [Gemmataceae bacterium]